MSTVVIIATSYDTPSNYSFGWATSLKDKLLKQGHSCVLIPGEGICAAGSTLVEAVERSDFVVFFGHGTPAELTRLPARGRMPSLPLIDVSDVRSFRGKPIYAGCCSSLGAAGAGLGTAYANAYPTGSYIGYAQKFGLEYENENHFGGIVVDSVVQYVNNTTASTVVQNLKNEWINLSNRFYSGNLSHNRNASMAGSLALSNSKHVGNK